MKSRQEMAMRNQTFALVASSFVFLTACPAMYNPSDNPNQLACKAEPQQQFALPIDINSDCWDGNGLRMVVRGVGPQAGEDRVEVALNPRTGEEQTSRKFTAFMSSWNDRSECRIQIDEPATGLHCDDYTYAGSTHIGCKRSDGSACSLSIETAPAWGGYAEPFEKYIDTYPADQYPNN